MTDQELMQALRCCVSSPKRDGCQDACVFHNGDISHCIPEMGKAAADRMEALAAENARLVCEKSKLEQEIGRLEAQNEHFRETAKMMTEWISVEERLPHFNDNYIVTACDEDVPDDEGIWFSTVVVVAEYYKGCWTWNDNGLEYDLTGIVTHWMAMPEPPKGG